MLAPVRSRRMSRVRLRAARASFALLLAGALACKQGALAPGVHLEPAGAAGPAAPAPTAEGTPPPGAENAPPLVLPAGWETLPRRSFELELVRWVPAAESRRPSAADLARLASGLSAGGETAARAALVLARARSHSALEVLLAFLERRVASPDDAASVVAAAAPRLLPERSAGPRLAALAQGRDPHPRLRVRVECAASAVRVGRDEVLGWLVAVLRLGASRPLPVPTPGEDELAEVQERAAEVLGERLGEPVRFEPYASAADREREAARLQARIAALR